MGDIVGEPGRKAVIARLAALKEQESIDFIVVNGENAADTGRGITKEIFEDFLKAGADVITTGKSSLECSKCLQDLGAKIAGYACIVDRSNGSSKINKIISQIDFNFPVFSENDLPEHLKNIKPIKPGSRKN